MATTDKTAEKVKENGAQDHAAEQVADLGIEVSDSPFSLELSQDQQDIRDWAHGFAEQTVRPAAHEWDEKEEFPWPVVQEAAKIGLYGFEAVAQFWADPSGLTFPIVNEELFWGDAGIGMAIFGTTLAVAGIYASGTPEQMVEWVPQCFGTPDDVKVAAFCASEPDAGSDVSGYRTTAKYDEAKDEWVLNGQKAWATNGGIANVHVVIASVDRELGSRGHAGLRHPPGDQGLRAGRQGQEARHPRQPHRRRPPRRLPDPRLVPARRQGEARREARQGPEGKKLEGPGRDEDLRALAPDGRPRRQWASPAPPTSTRSTTPRSARRSAARSSRTSRSRSRSPT